MAPQGFFQSGPQTHGFLIVACCSLLVCSPREESSIVCPATTLCLMGVVYTQQNSNADTLVLDLGFKGCLFYHIFRIRNIVLLQRLTCHTLTSLPSSGSILCELDGWAVFMFAALNLLKIVFITKTGGCLVNCDYSIMNSWPQY